MTSLTQTAIVARKVIRYTLFFIVFLIVGRILLSAAVTIYKKAFPTPPPKPTVSYGKLPKLPFPSITLPQGTTFSLETADGTLPKVATQAKVFFMPKLFPNLLSLSVAQDKAGKLGFSQNGQAISPTTYKFPSTNNPSTLEMNTVTGVFSISYDLKADPTPINQRPPVPEIAASIARSYLSGASILPADLTGPTTHEFLKLQDQKFVSALALSEASLVKINLFRKDYDSLPAVTPDPNTANVWFMVSGIQDASKQIVAAEFHYFPADETQFSTYPIKTSDEAWKELTAGQAFTANLGSNQNGAAIKIRKVYLAYYDAGVPVDFYQPVYVFEGDSGFVSYLSAVTSDYYGQ